MTTHGFDKDYWQEHWSQRPALDAGPAPRAHPYLERELGDLAPGAALDAGCGEGAEAIWLAARGWRVTAVDISTDALARAAAHEARSSTPGHVEWVEADLSVWEPGRRFDLVTTHYAHAAIPQLDLYDRLADWVAPGGTLLVVGHLHTHGQPGHGQLPHDGQPPAEASVTASSIATRLGGDRWEVVTADELARTMGIEAGRQVELHDVVVRATRRTTA